MKKYYMLLLLHEKGKKMRKLLKKRNLQDKQVLNLSRKIDKLQNKLYL